MATTKADRSAAAKKAAATRKRNQIRSKSSDRGLKAAASRHQNDARERLEDARRAGDAVLTNAQRAAKSAGDAAAKAGKSVAARVGLSKR